jgi:type I restriction enzyme, R subunit
MDPEQRAREKIYRLLGQAGWIIQNRSETYLQAARGVAIRESPLKQGHGESDYLIFIEGKAAGAIEAKPVGTTLTGVERQTERYSNGLPDGLPCHSSPLPFLYERRDLSPEGWRACRESPPRGHPRDL